MSTSLATRPRRRRMGSLIALATAAILAACGGGNGEEAAPEAPETTSEASEAAPEVPTGDGTSFEAPLPAGTELELKEDSETVWKVQVTGVEWDASDPDWAESPAGTYALVDVKVTRTGVVQEDNLFAADPFMSIWFYLFDLDGNELVASAELAPNDLFLVGDVAQGESATGQLIFEGPEGMDQGILAFSSFDGEQVFVVAN
jgi:hypothetical protein